MDRGGSEDADGKPTERASAWAFTEAKPRGLRLNPRAFVNKQTEVEDPDPDQEKSPTPDAQVAASTEAFDLWTAWSTRSISEGSSSIDSAQWRGNRSLSIDAKPNAPLGGTDELSLSSLSKSLHSLSFVASAREEEPDSPIFSSRPRSFSDYTSLSTNQGQRLSDHHALSLVSTSTQQLWHAIKSSFVSRHVVILNECGSFDGASRHTVDDLLKSCGAIASARDELAGEGLLFRTFFELKAAVRAVSLFSANALASIPLSAVSVAFALPYELPNEVNCATVLVQLLQAAPVPANEIRQYCACYGEVASVLHNDVQSGKYIVEFNDARDVVSAMLGLSCTVYPCGAMHVSRSHPPTLDMGMLRLVQNRMDEVTGEASRYSTNSTVLTSPSSVSSSPVEVSFMEGSANFSDIGGDNLGFSPRMPPMRVSASFDASALSVVSPSASSSEYWSHSCERTPTGRPRSSSAFASISSGSMGSIPVWASNLAPPVGPPMTAMYNYRYHHQSQGYAASSNVRRSTFHPRGYPDCGNMYPGGRSDGITTRRSFSGSIGRHDQGTGEFSLDLDKVISGEDTRTTLMIRNIPNKYTQHMLLAEINQHHHGQYDFFYLPIDFKNKCNVGYAFINFIDAAAIAPFCREFDNQKWTNFNSEKVCAISYARLQGKQAMITRFQNSSLLDKLESYRPLVFHSSGPKRGQPEPFPAPKHQSFHRRSTISGAMHLPVGGGSVYSPRMYATAAQCGNQTGPPIYVPSQHQHHGGPPQHGAMYGYPSAPLPPPPPQDAVWSTHQGDTRNTSNFAHYGNASRSTSTDTTTSTYSS